MCKYFNKFFKKIFGFITLQNYVNAKLGKTEMPMTSNEFKTESSKRK